jgi:hypothetical protein
MDEVEVADGRRHFSSGVPVSDLEALFEPVDDFLVFRKAIASPAQRQGQCDDHDQRAYQVIVGQAAVGDVKSHE